MDEYLARHIMLSAFNDELEKLAYAQQQNEFDEFEKFAQALVTDWGDLDADTQLLIFEKRAAIPGWQAAKAGLGKMMGAVRGGASPVAQKVVQQAPAAGAAPTLLQKTLAARKARGLPSGRGSATQGPRGYGLVSSGAPGRVPLSPEQRLAQARGGFVR